MSKIPELAPPPRILTVGVTGHRPERLANCDLVLLYNRVADVLAVLGSAANALAPTRLRLISALAEGADSIVADAAVSRGWEIDVILPFERSEYAEDFAEGDARENHARRVGLATAVFELPGERVLNGGAAAAYERAGRAVLAQADLLLAVWDGHPPRGRGGAAQIVAEGVLKGIPVLQVDPTHSSAPALLWDGLTEIDLGQQTTDTVARGDLAHIDQIIADLVDPPDQPDEQRMLALFQQDSARLTITGFAYPLFLAIMGVRQLRWSDVGIHRHSAHQASALAGCPASAEFAERLDRCITARFARADAVATRAAQLFRSGFVLNFALASFAVVLTMVGLALPSGARLYLLTLEFTTIVAILSITSAGNRAQWHRRWLDNRALAEQLRCLALTTQLGDLDLRNAASSSPWVRWYTQAAARELGLPDGRVDAAYLEGVKAELIDLVDGQISYLQGDARRMHRLDHRLHRVGSALFATTAVACLLMLGYRMLPAFGLSVGETPAPIGLLVTIMGAALPSIGAAIYGIRMQGDFAGVAARSETLFRDLSALRTVIVDESLEYDTLLRRVRRVADLMAFDLSAWLQTYTARPLTLPG